MPQRASIVVLVVAFASATGCQLLRTEPRTARAAATPPQAPAKVAQAPPPVARATLPEGPEASLESVLADLEKSGRLDAATREQVLSDLRQTDPALWPQYLAVFRSAQAYRGRHAPSSSTPATADPSAAPSESQASAVASDHKAPAEIATVAPRDTPAPGPQTPPAPTAPPGEIQQVAHRATLAAEGATSSREPTAEGWERELDAAIADLDRHLQASPDAELAARLGLLRLAADRRDEALRASATLAGSAQSYWSSQLYALSTFLETQRGDGEPSRLAEAAQHLRAAAGELAEMAPLVVRNPHFCTEVSSYGVFKPFDKYTFRPGQEVLLYCEIENFKSESLPEGQHTAMSARYRILDSQGREASAGELGRTEETCRNVRRDYFLRYFLTLPDHLYDGKYTLHLTVEDLTAKKFAQATIDLTIDRGTKPTGG